MEAGEVLNDLIVPILTPTTREQAVESTQKKLWIVAAKKELESVQKKKVLQLAHLLRGMKLLRTKWVHRESNMEQTNN